MGEKFKKWVEEGTVCQYVPMGSHCDLYGKKLGFFATGFWSCNTRHLYGLYRVRYKETYRRCEEAVSFMRISLVEM